MELFRDEFGADPIAMFEERASRVEVNNWRKKWFHPPKQHELAGTHATRVLNKAVEKRKLKEHHCHKLKKLYQSNRTEIILTSGDIAQFNSLRRRRNE